jgi:hypothetical protein
MSDDGHDSGEQRRREILAEARDMLERRLAQERTLIVDAIETLAQALNQQREVVGEAIARLRSERDDSRSAEFVRLWASITSAHEAIVAIQKDRLAETVARERPAAAKLN